MGQETVMTTTRNPSRPGDVNEPGTIETDAVLVRALAPEDLDAITSIDREWTGRPRREYFALKLREAERDTGVRISLAAVLDGRVAGFLLGRLYYGEFGRPEPVAVLDSIGVGKAFAGRHAAEALLRQLRMNLHALGIERLETGVAFDQVELLTFFARSGFRPAPRFCLEMQVTRPVE
jgi:predicted N-acetyltransferase YhbS